MTRLIIHAGLHKTGSSAVQTWLLRHQDLLLSEGIAFPADLTTENGNAPWVARALTTPVDKRSPEMREILEIFARFCSDHAGGDIIISAEYLEILFFPQIRSADIPRAQQGETAKIPALERFAPTCQSAIDLIRQFCDQVGIQDVSFVYLLRNSVEKYNSAYAQRVKSMVPNLFLDTALFDTCTRGYAFTAFSQNLLEQAGFAPKVDVFGANKQSPIDQVLDLAGFGDRLRAKASTKIETINESIGEIGVLAGDRMNRVLDQAGPGVDGKMRHRMSKVLRKSCAKLEERRFSGFSPQTAELHSANQAALDALLSPWLSAEKLAHLRSPRHAVERSARSLAELSEEGRSAVAEILARAAKSVLVWGGDLGPQIRHALLTVNDTTLSQPPAGHGANTDTSPQRKQLSAIVRPRRAAPKTN